MMNNTLAGNGNNMKFNIIFTPLKNDEIEWVDDYEYYYEEDEEEDEEETQYSVDNLPILSPTGISQQLSFSDSSDDDNDTSIESELDSDRKKQIEQELTNYPPIPNDWPHSKSLWINLNNKLSTFYFENTDQKYNQIVDLILIMVLHLLKDQQNLIDLL